MHYRVLGQRPSEEITAEFAVIAGGILHTDMLIIPLPQPDEVHGSDELGKVDKGGHRLFTRWTAEGVLALSGVEFNQDR